MLYYVDVDPIGSDTQWNDLSTAIQELVKLWHPKLSVFVAHEIITRFISYDYRKDPYIAGVQVARSWCFGFVEQDYSTDDHHACQIIHEGLKDLQPETDQKFAALHLLRMVFQPALETKIQNLKAIIRLAQNTGAVTDKLLLGIFNKARSLFHQKSVHMFDLYYHDLLLAY